MLASKSPLLLLLCVNINMELQARDFPLYLRSERTGWEEEPAWSALRNGGLCSSEEEPAK